MRAGVALVLLIGAAWTQGSTAAEPRPRSRYEDFKQREVRSISNNFGDCVVRHFAPLARAVILNGAGTDAINSEKKRLADSDCLYDASSGSADSARFNSHILRYVFAQALVRKDYPIARHFDFSATPPLAQLEIRSIDPAMMESKSPKRRLAVEQYMREQAYIYMSHYGECVSRAEPDKVHILQLTEIASAAETAAFKDLSGALAHCLDDGELKLDREKLRGALALNLYRLAGAPEGAPVETLKVKH